MSEAKVYFSNLPFCNIQVMRTPGYCTTHSFIGHRLETADPEIIKHLDEIVDRAGSGITSQKVAGLSDEQLAAQADARKDAEIAHGKMLAAGLSTA